MRKRTRRITLLGLLIALVINPLITKKLTAQPYRPPEPTLQLLQRNHLTLHAQPDLISAPLADSLARAMQERLAQTADLLGRSIPADFTFDYHLYDSFESQALLSKTMNFAAVSFQEQKTHVTYQETIRGDHLAMETRLLIRHLIGESVHAVLETGLRIQQVEYYHGTTWQELVTRIARTGRDLELRTLLDNDFYRRQSQFWREPLAGALVGFLLEMHTIEQFLEIYHRGLQSDQLASLEDEWNGQLKRWAGRKITTSHKPERAPGEMKKGFNFAHEGYRIYNGYGSRLSDRSMAALDTLGVNAIALNPYGFLPNHREPTPIRFARSLGSENSAATIHALLTAHSLGFSVLMKPHIWIRGSWPGEIEMVTEREWQQFFSYYEQWIRHYALMSQLYGAEALSLGLEMTKATLPYQERWVAMANRMRHLYDGQLTYAANWYREFENLAFWDAFDAIGVTCYFPLSDDPRATDAELLAGATAIAQTLEQVQQQYGKPLWIAEIGFTSSPASWVAPHEYARNAPVDLEAQSRSYRAMQNAFEGAQWLKGIYWWKWPSVPTIGGPNHSSFTPNRKPALDVVEAWFEAW